LEEDERVNEEFAAGGSTLEGFLASQLRRPLPIQPSAKKRKFKKDGFGFYWRRGWLECDLVLAE